MSRNGSIKNFFKPHVVPKNNRHHEEVVLDNIVVGGTRHSASPAPSTPSQISPKDKRSNKHRPHGRSATAPAGKCATAAPIHTKSTPPIEHSATPELQVRSSRHPGKSTDTKSGADNIEKPLPVILQASSPLSSPPSDSDEDDDGTSTVSSLSLPSETTGSKGIITGRSGPGASFQSTSTLSAPPPSSQMSHSSSRRIYQDGALAVTNSSSDIDPIGPMDEDTASDDTLVDFDAILSRKRRKMSPPPTSLPTPSTERRLRPRMNDAKVTPSGKQDPPRIMYKFSLTSLLEEKRREEQLNARLSELEQSIQRLHEAEKGADSPDTEDLGLVVSAAEVDDDGEEAGTRLKHAMQRMDALEKDVTFHFFEVGHEEHAARLAFPAERLPKKGWTTLLLETASRTQTILSGFAADMASVEALPGEVQEWMLGEILLEQREDLCYAYMGVLEACARHDNSVDLLDVSMLRDCFSRLGARSDILENSTVTQTKAVAVKGHKPSGVTSGLQNLVVLISKLSQRLSISARGEAVYLISLMSIDDSVQKDMPLRRHVQRMLVSLSEPSNEEDWVQLMKNVGDKILSTIDHPVLLERLLLALPVSCGRMAHFRRALAFSRTSGVRMFTHTELSRPNAWIMLQTCIQSSQDYAIHEKTDYVLLKARLGILDIAVGAGFSDLSFLSPSASGTKFGDQEQDPSKPSFCIPATISDAEQSFNSSVDSMAAILKKMLSNIRDAGAAHMRRTECKSAIDRLLVRLEFAVRTRPKPKKGVFGRASTGMEGLGGVMERYLASKKRKAMSDESHMVDDITLVDEGAECMP